MKRKERKLTRLILGALMSAGGALLSLPSVTAAQDTTVDDARVAADSAEGYAVYGNNTGNIKYFKEDAESDPVGNTITVNTTKTLGSVRGGHSAVVHHYSVSGNTVNMKDGSITSNIFGGESSNSGNVMNNTVNVSGGTVGNAVGGGVSALGNVTGNVVNISGGTIKGNAYGGTMSVGASSSSVSGNTIVISGGTINGNVFGGHAQVFGGDVTGNTVTISGGTVGSDTSSMHYGGYSNSGDAEGNAFNVEGGIVNGNIYGAQGVNVTNNTVNISGGTINGIIYPAMAMGGTASGNVINILKVFNTTSGVFLDGEDGGGYTSTLNVAAKGVTVNGMFTPFQQMNFFLPTDMTKDDVMLNVSGDANVTDAKVGVLAQGKLSNLSTGDKVTLLSAGTLTGGSSISQTTDITVPTGIATVNTYTFDVAAEDNDIVATITSDTSGVNEDAKSVVETRAATTTFIDAGADMLASQGFMQAANAVALQAAEQAQSSESGGGEQGQSSGAPAGAGGFTPFAAFGGSSMRAESGSHVDTKGFGLNVGFARELENSQGKLLFGPVVEYGGGKYDSYLDNGTHGEGNSHYWGIGIMARQVNHDGFYYEGSLRGGRVTSDYSGHFNSQDVSYDSASPYIAAHLGAGKVMKLSGNNTLDGYLKYFYSHQNGDNVTMHGSTSGDDQWSFDSVNSHRVRIGARLTHKINEKNSLYGGLAYQYEFGGEARAHYSSGEAPSPSVKGSSGMLELGWQVKPGEGPLTLDLGVTGWAGKQRGGSVQLGATWAF